MNNRFFNEKLNALRHHHEALLSRKNEPGPWGNGIYEKYQFPILTAEHTPLEWRYDFSPEDNPFLMQRIMMNAVLNAGAIKLDGRYLLVCRVEGADRKSFFAVAESPNGIDSFRFWPQPIENHPNLTMAQLDATLPYFDGAQLIRHSRAEIYCEIGLIDTTCPPSAVWALLNNAKGKKTVNCVPYRTHAWPSGERRQPWEQKYLRPREAFINDYLK